MPSLVTAAGLHHHQRDGVFTAERGQFCNARRIVIEARKPMPGFDADIELGFRNVHSTNRLLHGNLPCPCDRNSSDCSVVRDMAKIPKLIRGCSRRGNGRLRHAPWPVATGQGAKSLPSHKFWPCRYKGVPVYQVTSDSLRAPSPQPSPRKRGEGAHQS